VQARSCRHSLSDEVFIDQKFAKPEPVERKRGRNGRANDAARGRKRIGTPKMLAPNDVSPTLEAPVPPADRISLPSGTQKHTDFLAFCLAAVAWAHPHFYLHHH
jgi:hypothetical protein